MSWRYCETTSSLGPSAATLPVLQPVGATAEPRHGLHVVRDEEHGAPRAGDLLDPAHAALLELVVADGEHLVDDQHLRVEVRRDGECEPHVHPARVPLDRRVDELPDPAELDDVVELRVDLAPLHAEDRAVQVRVLAARQLGMEARADLEDAPDATADHRAALGRRRDPGQQLEERRLAGAVLADEADDLALLDREGHVLERPELLQRVVDVLEAERAPDGVRQRVAKRLVPGAVLADPVALREPVGDDGLHHIVSAKRGSARR